MGMGWVRAAQGARATGAAAAAAHLSEQLRHDPVGRYAAGQCVRVLSVVAVLLVRGPDAVRHEGRDRLRGGKGEQREEGSQLTTCTTSLNATVRYLLSVIY